MKAFLCIVLFILFGLFMDIIGDNVFLLFIGFFGLLGGFVLILSDKSIKQSVMKGLWIMLVVMVIMTYLMKSIDLFMSIILGVASFVMFLMIIAERLEPKE